MVFVGLPKQQWAANQWRSRGLPPHVSAYLAGLRGDPRRVAARLFNMADADAHHTAVLVCPDMVRLDNIAFDALPDVLEAIFDGRIPDCDRTNLTGRHLFICTHGVRDKCCAKFGFGAVRSIRRTLEADQHLADTHAVWETSHLVGDRFAGTGIVYPEGRMFGRLDEESADGWLRAISKGEIDFTKYRGSVFLPPKHQVVEAELLRHLWTIGDFDRLRIMDTNREDMIRFEVLQEKSRERTGFAMLRPRTFRVQATCKQVDDGVYGDKTTWWVEQIHWD
ncbi:MAG: hypothetical protein Hens3KO_13760 [Henriciella sp.]